MDVGYDQKRCTREFDGLPLIQNETRRSRRTLDTNCDQAEQQMGREEAPDVEEEDRGCFALLCSQSILQKEK